jgi:hypothetical protein
MIHIANEWDPTVSWKSNDAATVIDLSKLADAIRQASKHFTLVQKGRNLVKERLLEDNYSVILKTHVLIFTGLSCDDLSLLREGIAQLLHTFIIVIFLLLFCNLFDRKNR